MFSVTLTVGKFVQIRVIHFPNLSIQCWIYIELSIRFLDITFKKRVCPSSARQQGCAALEPLGYMEYPRIAWNLHLWYDIHIQLDTSAVYLRSLMMQEQLTTQRRTDLTIVLCANHTMNINSPNGRSTMTIARLSTSPCVPHTLEQGWCRKGCNTVNQDCNRWTNCLCNGNDEKTEWNKFLLTKNIRLCRVGLHI